jgi:hypothetical protein
MVSEIDVKIGFALSNIVRAESPMVIMMPSAIARLQASIRPRKRSAAAITNALMCWIALEIIEKGGDGRVSLDAGFEVLRKVMAEPSTRAFW